MFILPWAAAGAAAAPAATTEFRPAYHFSPAKNWMNDPNGLVWLNGTYHMFYQYNPYGDRWGHMSWGHAQSRDLYHWQELPVALSEDDSYMIFSGSVVVDEQNSSGFGQAERAPLVALYTGSQRGAAGIQNQQVAYSNDAALTWTKFTGNPVLDLDLHAFRDPKVFWYEPAHQWIMVAVLSDAHRVTFYGSSDLKIWRHLSDFGPAGGVDGAWECPDLFVLPVINAPGEVRWILKVDVFKSATVAGSGAQYFVGTFDGRAFTTEPEETAQPVDYGKDFYAAASWSHLPASAGRHVWIGWMSNHEYAQEVPTAPWRGAMSVPREVSLRRSPTGYELLQAPAAELHGLRRRHRRRVSLDLNSRRESTSLVAALSPAAEIVATLEPRDAREFGLQVRVGVHEKTLIGYDVKSQRLFVDRSNSGRSDFSPGFAQRQWAPLALSHALRLHVLLDRSSVEVFAGDGQRVLTEQIFPAAGSLGLRAYARQGTAVLRKLDVWDLTATVGE
jgi:fructan beta-fructosidase